MSQADRLYQQLMPLINKINRHPLYQQIKSLQDLRIFMQHHVFAVWDFMCLLKALHSKLVCTQAPWFPPLDAKSARLISQILVEEEGDVFPDEKNYQSHFEMYLAAMQEVGADIKPIQQLLMHLKPFALLDACNAINIPNCVKQFVQTTFSFFNSSVHEIAAVFVFGREAITQMMFQPILNQLKNQLPIIDQDRLQLVQYYFNRHITLDSEEHFPKALQMLTRLCGKEESRWQQAKIAAHQALLARLEFLTAIQNNLTVTMDSTKYLKAQAIE